MAINWTEIGWWIIAVIAIAQVYGSAHHIITHL